MPQVKRRSTRKGQVGRVLQINNREHNKQHKYADNFIKTSKYTLLTFLPVNLFEQFRRVANMYFLLQIIIMSIPEITALKPESTAVPLCFVLAATAVKDAYDDIKRHRSDKGVNNRKCKVLMNSRLETKKWMEIHVGDILRLENNDQVPADVVVLTTSEENGLCYIETAELDGETNLKCRQPLPETGEMGDDEDLLGNYQGEASCDHPNNRLDKFHGRLVYEDKEYSLDNDNVLLRGCVLRNTDWVYGVVVYAGQDSKLMMNSGVSKFKRTNLDKLLNKLIIGIAILLAVICALLSIGKTIWEHYIGKNFQVFLPWPSFYMDSTVFIGVTHWPSFVMVLNTLIPISLYISVEVIRVGQSLWINWDTEMYYPTKDSPARARTTTLTEELGQIEYIFSDKTGTLTQNVMTFKMCSVQGKMYGVSRTKAELQVSTSLTVPCINTTCPYHSCFFQCPLHGRGDGQENDEKMPSISEDTSENVEAPKVDFSNNKYYDGKFQFNDQMLVDDITNNNKDCHEIMRLLAVCHTVMIENKDGDLQYQAQSPDEAALVTAARNFGFVFKERSPTTLTLDVLGTEEHYELLAILDFNNERKRMSVIVRTNDNIRLYCKGADSIVYELLDPSCKELMSTTTDHLNFFACEGLRTLVTAYKDIPPEVYKEWNQRYHAASVSMEDRDEKVQALYEEIEQNLILIGATAIEDKLQDGVPSTIATLAAADIKIWVLTGDKPETAVNIGYSCQLLTDDMTEVFTINGESMESVRNSISEYKKRVKPHEHVDERNLDGARINTVKNDNGIELVAFKDNQAEGFKQSNGGKSNGEYGLVITGKSLVHALDKSLELDFLELACACKAIICCRVTPLQKALVVQLVKRNKNAVTLAIGDGANDVSMIKAAHIGVGISGQEGMQAVLASDYSFAQFRYLERVLLIHGRWSYMRMCKFLNYFFYKNFAFTLVQFWYALFSGYSAQTLYDAWFISFYNVLFTSGPVVFLAIFDQDVSDKSCAKYPKLYIPGQKNMLFNKKVFCYSLIYGTLTSLGLFFMAYGAFHKTVDVDGKDTESVKFFGTVVAAALVIVVNIEICLMTQYWTWINHFFTWGSILFYFIFYFAFYSEFVFSYFPQMHYFGVQYQVFGNPVFWLYLALVTIVTTLPSIATNFVRAEVSPRYSDAVRRKEQNREPTRLRPKEFRPKLNLRRKSFRTNYAFSHQEGFGKIVMTPKSFFRKKFKVNK